MRVLWEGECVKLGIIVESREQFEPLGTVDVIINGIHREGRQRRGTLRRYALRETGESVLNRGIPKGRPRRKSRRGQSFWGDFPLLRVNRFQSSNTISRRP